MIIALLDGKFNPPNQNSPGVAEISEKWVREKRPHPFFIHIMKCLFHRSVYLGGIQLPDGAPEFLPPTVEEDEGGGVLKAIDWRQGAPGPTLDIQAENNQATFILCFDPIHDGFHCCASQSVR
jgi:hypothetical protein